MKIAKRRKVKQTPQEKTVQSAYREIDKVIADYLKRKEEEENIVTSCRDKCSACCNQPIQTLLPEGHAAAQYIKRNFKRDQLNALRERVENWFEWINNRLPELEREGLDFATALYNEGPGCPMLENDSCSIYPARPNACRVHFVTSDPRKCLPYNDPDSIPGEADMIQPALDPGVQRQAKRILDLLYSKGISAHQATMLLPQWIAIEMGWKNLKW